MEIVLFLLCFICWECVSVAQLTIRAYPEMIDVGDPTPVRIQCSLDLRSTPLDVIYSIMIKKRGSTCVILFQDGSSDTPNKRYKVENYELSKTRASLLISIQGVTCDDRGEYSCQMAVRRSWRNFKLGPVISPLKVNDIGKPYKLYSKVVPEKAVYKSGDTVQLTCYILQGTTNKGWIWERQDKAPVGHHQDACHHSDVDCMYKCRSTLSHTVSDNDDGVKFFCAVAEVATSVVLNVAKASTAESKKTSEANHGSNTKGTNATKTHTNNSRIMNAVQWRKGFKDDTKKGSTKMLTHLADQRKPQPTNDKSRNKVPIQKDYSKYATLAKTQSYNTLAVAIPVAVIIASVLLVLVVARKIHEQEGKEKGLVCRKILLALNPFIPWRKTKVTLHNEDRNADEFELLSQA